MNYGGDAADQIVRYSLEGIDYSLRLSGTLAKNLAVFFAAVLKDQKKTYGKTRMVRMLKENKPLKFFTVPSDRLKEFAREGKSVGFYMWSSVTSRIPLSVRSWCLRMTQQRSTGSWTG